MTSVSTVSGGITGTYESYDSATPSYDTDFTVRGGSERSTVEKSKPYEGTGGCEKRCPRSACACVPVILERRARCRALCAGGRTAAGVGVAA